MSFITAETFDVTKISLGKIIKATKPVHYQRVPILYKYENGKTGPFVIRTPRLTSFGVYVNRDNDGLSLPMLMDSKSVVFQEAIKQLTEAIRNKMDKLHEALKEGGKKRKTDVESLTIIKERKNSDPCIFAKMYKDTPFKMNVKGKLEKAKAESFVKQKFQVVAALKIDSVFVGAKIESIQVKLNEAAVIKKILKITPKTVMDDIPLVVSDESSDDESEFSFTYYWSYQRSKFAFINKSS